MTSHAAGRVLAPGSGSGEIARLTEPLSLWGGLDPATGRVIDPHHPQHGRSLAGRVVAMPGGRGSSSSSSVLAEAVRAGVAPAAILVGEADLILSVGARVAAELYGAAIPVVQVGAEVLQALHDGDPATVAEDGAIAWRR